MATAAEIVEGLEKEDDVVTRVRLLDQYLLYRSKRHEPQARRRSVWLPAIARPDGGKGKGPNTEVGGIAVDIETSIGIGEDDVGKEDSLQRDSGEVVVVGRGTSAFLLRNRRRGGRTGRGRVRG